MPRLPRSLVCAALLVLCSCGALAPQDTSEEAGDAGDADTGAETGTTTPTGGADSDAPPPDPADIVVATYNVRRFFDANCDSNQCGSGDYEDVLTESQFEYRADKLAEALLALDADIMILQEIENQNCMDALSARLGDEYPTAILGELENFKKAGSVDVAILARHPSTDVRRHADAPLLRPSGGQTWFSREFLEVHLDVEGHDVIAFAAHFKAKSDDDPERRLAEALRAREIIDAVAGNHPDALVVLGGDLNDTPGSPPIDALEAGGGMLRVAAELAPDDWTYEYMNNKNPIDHIYAATAATGGVYIPGSARVFRSENGEDGYAGSDHAAVRASFHAE